MTSDSVFATADICAHGYSSSLCVSCELDVTKGQRDQFRVALVEIAEARATITSQSTSITYDLGPTNEADIAIRVLDKVLPGWRDLDT